MWINEGYSQRQLIEISDHGIWKIKQIKKYWLNKLPPASQINFSSIKYLLFDGTYFKHENCLMILMDNLANDAVAHQYCLRENFTLACQIFQEAKDRGVNPVAITIDGNTSVIRALKTVWPGIIIQRCLAHVQRQGLSWLRRNPKSDAAKTLRWLLLTITEIHCEEERQVFVNNFQAWEKQYGSFVLSLLTTDKVFGDLQRTRSLIIHALPDMFHYLYDNNIASTTNKIEGYFSRLKQIYRQHRGLSKRNRKNYFAWYIYFKNHR